MSLQQNHYNSVSFDQIVLIFGAFNSPCKSAGHCLFRSPNWVMYSLDRKTACFLVKTRILSPKKDNKFWRIFMMYMMDILRGLSIQISLNSISWIYWQVEADCKVRSNSAIRDRMWFDHMASFEKIKSWKYLGLYLICISWGTNTVFFPMLLLLVALPSQILAEVLLHKY